MTTNDGPLSRHLAPPHQLEADRALVSYPRPLNVILPLSLLPLRIMYNVIMYNAIMYNALRSQSAHLACQSPMQS